MKIKKLIEKESGFDDLDEYDYSDYSDNEFDEEYFVQDIYSLLNSLIIDDDLNEEFMSHSSLEYHFNKHCIGKNNNKSKYTSVLYDFKDKNQYKQYEIELNNNIRNSDLVVSSLFDTDLVLKYFRKLFEGNVTICFDKNCGFKNAFGPVAIYIHSFATNVTKNYLQNTIDICIKPGNKFNKSITLYPVDAYYLETKFNNIVEKYNSNTVDKFYFNK